jgi:hypothetical protein
MNKLLTRSLLALTVVALTAAPSFAGRTFGLFVGCGHCCGGCNFCVRPYNAFSPVCSGSICCDGCLPFGGGGNLGLNYSGFPAGCQAMGECTDGVPMDATAQFPFSGQAPAMAQAPTPVPTAMQGGAGYPTWNAAMPYNPMQPAGYQLPYPGYNYGYAPMNVPAYWNAGR